MARKYTVVEIDGVNYELHGVKVDKKPIGFVPVRVFEQPDHFRAFVAKVEPGELELVLEDYKYGLAVRLQGMARKSVSGEGFNEAAMNQVWPTLTDAEKSMSFKEVNQLAKDKWAEIRASGLADGVDEKYVWENLL